MKEQKGITLVALVITIIVLLILAGVSLSLISGDDGILSNASEAKKQTEISNAKDAVGLAVQTLVSDYYEGRYSTNTINSSVTIQSYISSNLASKVTGYTVSVSGTTVTVSGGGLPSNITGTLAANGSLTWN